MEFHHAANLHREGILLDIEKVDEKTYILFGFITGYVMLLHNYDLNWPCSRCEHTVFRSEHANERNAGLSHAYPNI